MFLSIINPFLCNFTPFLSTSFFYFIVGEIKIQALFLYSYHTFSPDFHPRFLLFADYTHFLSLSAYTFFSALLSFPWNKFDYLGGSGAYNNKYRTVKKASKGEFFRLRKCLKQFQFYVKLTLLAVNKWERGNALL